MKETAGDILAPGLDVIFCGLNPPPSVGEGGYAFATASNRFWRVLHLSGFTPRRLEPAEERLMLDFRCGLTVAVRRPTKSASEVSRREFVDARPDLEATILRYRPRAIAFLGKAAIAAMSGTRNVAWGRQPRAFAEAAAWVLPNPSGLNRSFSLSDLVAAFRTLREDLAP